MPVNQNQGQERDRWAELAELLGLPPDQSPRPEPAPAVQEVTREEQEVTREKFVEPERFAEEVAEEVLEEEDVYTPREEAPQAVGDAFEGATEASLEQHFLDEEEEADLDEGVTEDLPEGSLEETSVLPSELGEGEDRPRRGKRRRRRGRKGRGPREGVEGAEETSEAGAAPRESVVGEEIAPAGAANAEEEGRGRRRGRRRRSGGRPGEHEEPVRARSERVTPSREPLAEPEFDEESALDQDEVDEVERRPFGDEEDDDDDMSESDPFRDWNVPMWPDLIASLYRPER